MSKVEEEVRDGKGAGAAAAGAGAGTIDVHLSAGAPIDEAAGEYMGLDVEVHGASADEAAAAMAGITTSTDATIGIALELIVQNSVTPFALGGICGSLQTAHDAFMDTTRRGSDKSPFERDSGYSGRLEMLPFEEGGQGMLRVTFLFDKPKPEDLARFTTEALGVRYEEAPALSAQLSASIKLVQTLDKCMAAHSIREAAPSQGDIKFKLAAEPAMLDTVLAGLRSEAGRRSHVSRADRQKLTFWRCISRGKLELNFDDMTEMYEAMGGETFDKHQDRPLRGALMRDLKRGPAAKSHTALNLIENLRTSFVGIKRLRFVAKRPCAVGKIECHGLNVFTHLPDRVEMARPDVPPTKTTQAGNDENAPLLAARKRY